MVTILHAIFLLAGRHTVASAATVLDLSVRQVGQLLLRYRDDGGGGLIHKDRGKPTNHRANEGVREYALELVRTQYRDFGPPGTAAANCGGGTRSRHLDIAVALLPETSCTPRRRNPFVKVFRRPVLSLDADSSAIGSRKLPCNRYAFMCSGVSMNYAIRAAIVLLLSSCGYVTDCWAQRREMKSDRSRRDLTIPWPAAYDPSRAPVFSHIELLIHADCHRAFTQLADANSWPNWLVIAKDVANETPDKTGKALCIA